MIVVYVMQHPLVVRGVQQIFSTIFTVATISL